MLGRATVVLVTIGVVFVVTTSGCSQSAIAVPSDRDIRTRRPDYVPGLVYAYFDRDAPLSDVENVARSFGLKYSYIAKGEVWVTGHVAEGDALDVQERVSLSPLVNQVDQYPSAKEGMKYLRIRFVVGVTLDNALTFAATYPEIVVAGSRRALFYAEFKVAEGDEDKWVKRFLEEDLVIDSHKAWLAWPAVE